MKSLLMALGVGVSIMGPLGQFANCAPRELHVLLGDTREAPYAETAPGRILSTFNAAVLGQLIGTDKNFNLVSGHLESWDWDYKNEEYVLRIKKGLKFHSGREVTSSDLEFSLLRGFFSKNQSFYRTYLSNVHGVDKILPGTIFKSGSVAGVRVVDPLTIRIKLSNPNPSFLLGLTGPYFSFVPMEALNDDYLSWKDFPIGVGPFKVMSPFKNGETTIAKVSNAASSELVVKLHTRAEKRHYDISIFDGDILDKSELKLQLSDLPASVMNISFSNQNSISKTLEFREFVRNVISKERLVEGIDGLVATEEMLPKHLWGRTGLKVVRDYGKARKQVHSEFKDLVKSGIRLSVFSGPVLNLAKKEVVSRLTSQFSDLGIKLTYETSLNKFTTLEEARRCHIFLSGMVSDYIDPLVMFASLTKRGADVYTRSTDDEQLEKIYSEASKNSQRETRIQSLQALSKYVNEKIYVLPLAEEKVRMFYNRNTVKSLGSQNQPLTLFLERVELL